MGSKPESSPEDASPFAAFSHRALIDRYYETEGSPNVGLELSIRLFRHAGLVGDPTIMPLIGRNGAQVEEGGRPLMLADYVNFAAKHHFEAVESILDFLTMQPGTQDYDAMRASMVGRLEAGRQ